MALLALENLYAGYGKTTIISDISFQINADDIGVIAGPNGACKSTCLKAIFGLNNTSDGRVVLKNENITKLTPDKLVN